MKDIFRRGRHAINIRSFSKSGLLSLLVVYIVWSSTYLAIRIAVRPGSGFTPFMLGTCRAAASGVILLTMGALTRQRMRPSRHELVTLIGAALMLWLAGNGLIMVAEQHADSGLAALMVASVPIWAAAIEAIRDRKLPSLAMVAALLVGLLGIATLTMPSLLSGVRADTFSVLALLAGSLSWAAGTVLQGRRRVALAPVVNSGYQFLFATFFFGAAALVTREPLPAPNPAALGAWAYLVMFGSVVAFTAYVIALRSLPTRIVTTYSYVNPILALVLGWIILDERITIWTVIGAALVLVGVTGVFRAHAREARAAQPEANPGETEALNSVTAE